MGKIGENIADDIFMSLDVLIAVVMVLIASAMYAPYAKAAPIYRCGDSYSLEAACDGISQVINESSAKIKLRTTYNHLSLASIGEPKRTRVSLERSCMLIEHDLYVAKMSSNKKSVASLTKSLSRCSSKNNPSSARQDDAR